MATYNELHALPEPTPVDPPLTDRERIERLETQVFGEVYPNPKD